jgi:hypothetical protein
MIEIIDRDGLLRRSKIEEVWIQCCLYADAAVRFDLIEVAILTAMSYIRQLCCQTFLIRRVS